MAITKRYMLTNLLKKDGINMREVARKTGVSNSQVAKCRDDMRSGEKSFWVFIEGENWRLMERREPWRHVTGHMKG